MAYSPNGDLLVTCCIDGGVAIHNPRRQNLPVKMMQLEFPPQHIYVAFTSSVWTGAEDENKDPNGKEES